MVDIALAPRLRNTSRKLVNTMVKGLNLASHATMTAVKPRPPAMVVVMVWSVPPTSSNPATPQTAPLRERQADGSRHPFDQFIIAKTPAARWGEPADLMGPAVFLASDASNFVNGHVLYVDGGILAYIGKQP